MKSISTLFRQLSLIVVLISAFSLSAWGEETLAYTISFENSKSTDGSQAYTINNFVDNAIISGKEYVSSCSETSKCYQGKDAVKLGTSSAIGSFTLYLSEIGKINATKVIIYTSQYSSDSGKLNCSINDGSAISITPSNGSGTCIVNASINKIKISTSSKRAYVHKIEVYHESSEPMPEYTVTFETGTGTCTKNSLTGTSMILPIATSCNPEWTFAGWSEREITETTTTPTLFEAGENYTPQSDITLYAVYVNETTETTNSGTIWVPKSISDITSSDVVVITMKNSGGVYAATNNNGTGSAPAATEVTVDSNNQLTGTIEDNIKWNISNSSGNLTIYPNGTTEKWLYCTSTNNGVRVGDNANKTFTIDADYLKHTGTSRYLGVYNSQDWRCYTSINNNIQGQTLSFYVQTTGSTTVTTYTYNSNPDCSGSQPDEKEPTISVSDSELDFGDVIKNNDNESTKTITITTVDLGESASISVSGTNASYFAVNPTSIEDNSETEITITFTAPDVDVETECTATLTITGGEQTKEIALTATVKPLLALTANINNNELTQEIGAFVEGADITSALNTINVTAPEGWSFAGWVANAIDGSQTTTPEYLTTMPAEATTAYAVFKLGKEVNKEFSFAITAADFNGTSYTANNNEKTSTATAIDGTETEVKWTSYQVMLQEKAMQWQKSNGYIYNSTDLGTITDIDITSSAGTFTTHKGTSEKPTSEGEGGYFQIKTGSSGVGKTSGVTITFEKSVSSYTYRTSVSSLIVTNNDIETISENVNSLTLHVDKTPNTQLKVTETITADKVTVIQTIDASRWFFFSLPFDCNISDIVATYVNGGAELEYAPDESTGDYVIAKYNGGWEELLGDNKPTLNANQGYIIGHFGSGDVTVKFPSNGAQNISAPANATLAKTSDNGFNLIGLPYFQKVNVSLNNVNHLSIPNEDGETYNQTDDLSLLANIAPFTSFFVQTEAENIEFTLGAQQNAAPRLDGRSNRSSLHKAVVTLTDANGGADKTTIINNPSKTTDYEIGHDLTKLIGYASIPQIYSLQGDEMLAFNSLAIDNSTVIPLGVYAHADGEYTFALSEKSVGNLEGWELYDNETGKTTRLANEELIVNLTQGTHEGRFEIRLQQRISTDCDNAMGDMTTWTANGTLNINNLPADAVVYIYDAVGRMVYVANNNSTTFNYTFAARGVYNIVVRTAENSVSFKTIY